MNCPKCHYALANPNQVCPRCQGNGLRSMTSHNRKGSAHPQVPTRSASNLSTPQNHSTSPLRTTPSTSPASTQPTSTPSNSISFSCCPLCRNTDSLQRVSAIVRAGTWSEEGHWNQNTTIDSQTYGSSIGVAWDDRNLTPITTASGSKTTGNAQSTGSSSTSGSTTLARLLAAPVRPAEPVRNENLGCAGTMGCITTFLVLGWLGGVVATWFLFTLMVLLAVITVVVSRDSGKKYQSLMADYPHHLQSWNLCLSRWQKLFYCPKCDSVFNSETGSAAPVTEMYILLNND